MSNTVQKSTTGRGTADRRYRVKPSAMWHGVSYSRAASARASVTAPPRTSSAAKKRQSTVGALCTQCVEPPLVSARHEPSARRPRHRRLVEHVRSGEFVLDNRDKEAAVESCLELGHLRRPRVARRLLALRHHLLVEDCYITKTEVTRRGSARRHGPQGRAQHRRAGCGWAFFPTGTHSGTAAWRAPFSTPLPARPSPLA